MQVKHLFLVPVALLAGLLAGSWVPRNDLKKAELKIKELEQRLADQRPSSARLRSFTDVLGMSSAAAAGRTETTGSPPAAAAGSTNAPGTNAVAAAGTNAPGRPRGPWGEGSLKEQLDRAADLWRTRADIARNSLVTSASFSPADAASFDLLMQSMNLRLSSSLSNWADRIRADRAFDSEDGARMLNELTGVFVLTYDEMNRKLPANWKDGAGQSFDLITFVDPAVATPLIGVEDTLRDGMDQRRRRRHGGP